MTPQNIAYFISGLKQAIHHSETTQEKFAEGVTSKVNLSNVLRGVSGTSQKMREALAAKAGTTVEELVVRGTQLNDPYKELPEDDKHAAINVTEMSASSIQSEIHRRNQELHVSINEHTQFMYNTVTELIQERTKLLNLWAQDRSILNTMQTAVMLVGKDGRIVHCNRATTEAFGLFPGDNCKAHSGCHGCTKSDCAISTAFATGRAKARIGYKNGRYTECKAVPVTNEFGEITQVVMGLRDVSPLVQAIKDCNFDTECSIGLPA